LAARTEVKQRAPKLEENVPAYTKQVVLDGSKEWSAACKAISHRFE
jgi:hypothetical protein